MDNPVLETELDPNVLAIMSYAQLSMFATNLVVAIKDLEGMKEIAVLSLMDKKAVEFQGYIHNAMTNKDRILKVMMTKEAKACLKSGMVETEREKLWLN